MIHRVVANRQIAQRQQRLPTELHREAVGLAAIGLEREGQVPRLACAAEIDGLLDAAGRSEGAEKCAAVASVDAGMAGTGALDAVEVGITHFRPATEIARFEAAIGDEIRAGRRRESRQAGNDDTPLPRTVLFHDGLLVVDRTKVHEARRCQAYAAVIVTRPPW